MKQFFDIEVKVPRLVSDSRINKNLRVWLYSVIQV